VTNDLLPNPQETQPDLELSAKSSEFVQQSAPHRKQVAHWSLKEGIECSFAAKLHLAP
jgi:hypothetical protein